MTRSDPSSETTYRVQIDGTRVASIVKRPRIGVDYAGHWAKRLLRFYIRGNPYVSRP